MEIPFHPLANIFPLLEGVQFRDLVEDIRVHGLQEPIILFDGAILDGRNRARACVAAQVSARYKTYDGRDPVAFVVSSNLHRRHLDVSQRAMIAASISEKKSGMMTRRGPSKKIGGKIAIRPRPPRVEPPASRSDKISHEQAATLLGVSSGSVSQAHRVTKSGIPELAVAVNAGEVSVSAAATIAAFPKEQQRNILSSGSKAVTVIAREEMTARRGTRHAKHHRPSSALSWDTFKIGDGRSIGGVRFGECANLEQLMSVTAAVLREIRMHVANANHGARIKDVVTAPWLSETIDRIWDQVKSSAAHTG